EGIPGMCVALKTVQQHQRGITRSTPLHVMQLQSIKGDKFILSKGGYAHREFLPDCTGTLQGYRCPQRSGVMSLWSAHPAAYLRRGNSLRADRAAAQPRCPG